MTLKAQGDITSVASGVTAGQLAISTLGQLNLLAASAQQKVNRDSRDHDAWFIDGGAKGAKHQTTTVYNRFNANSVAIGAGITSMASQAVVSFVGNNGNIAATLNDLGSSASMRNIATAMASAGAVSALGSTVTMEVNGVQMPLNSVSLANGASPMQLLGRNLVNGVASTTIGTAINGGDLGDNLAAAIANAFVSTGAAYGANEIGDWMPTSDAAINALARDAAHAILGCTSGAALGGNSQSCAAGAAGAVMGHLAGQGVLARNPVAGDHAIAIGNLMGGIAGAFTSGTAQGTHIGAAAGANAVENNRLLHPPERERIAIEANGDEARRAALTRAACYAVQCWAQYPQGTPLYNANYVSAVEAAALGPELAWVASEQRNGYFQHTRFERVTDGIAATTGLASGTLNGHPISTVQTSLTSRQPCTNGILSCASGVPYGRDGDQYGPPDYVTLQGSVYAFSGGVSVNLRTLDVFGQWSLGRSYPAYGGPGVSLIAGSVIGSRGGQGVNEFLAGASAQANVFLPVVPVAPWLGIGGGVNHSYGGSTAAETGISIPPGASASPMGYGFAVPQKGSK